MSSEWELDEGIKSIKSAWRREHTARANLEKMLEQAEAENAKLQGLVTELAHTTVKCQNGKCVDCQFGNPTGFGCMWNAHMRELGIEVEG